MAGCGMSRRPDRPPPSGIRYTNVLDLSSLSLELVQLEKVYMFLFCQSLSVGFCEFNSGLILDQRS